MSTVCGEGGWGALDATGGERERGDFYSTPGLPFPATKPSHARTRTHAPATSQHLLQAEFFTTAVSIAKSHKAECEKKGLKKVVEFRASLRDDDAGTWPEQLKALKAQVLQFARSFPVVGFDAKTAKY